MIVALLFAAMMADAPKPPVVPDALRADFFKAQAELIDAQDKMQKKSAAMTSVVEKLNNLCGDRAQFQMTQDNEPTCVATIPVVNGKPTAKADEPSPPKAAAPGKSGSAQKSPPK